jgi:Holliday junction resolvase RusA-like endonuclease
MLEASRRVMPWRAVVAACAAEAGVGMCDGDVSIDISAYWVRPASHLRADGRLKLSAPPRPGYADCDKLARAVCDALAGIAYRNDRQVAQLSVARMWCKDGQPQGAKIIVKKLD